MATYGCEGDANLPLGTAAMLFRSHRIEDLQVARGSSPRCKILSRQFLELRWFGIHVIIYTD
jgi:hypothetical protein